MSRTVGAWGDEWVYLKDKSSMENSYRKTLARPFLFSFTFYMNVLRNPSSAAGLAGPPFLAVKVFSRLVQTVCHWPRALSNESSLTSGCGLSHKSALCIRY